MPSPAVVAAASKPMVVQQPQLPVMTAASETFAKDAVIAWFRGEFAAANAIIDALCSHLTQLEGVEAAAYESAFAAIHRRRLNWIPILQMQKYFPIADVAEELKNALERNRSENELKVEEVANGGCAAGIGEKEKDLESSLMSNESGGGDVGEGDEDFSSEITDTGSQEVHHCPENIQICSNHEACEDRRAQIKMTKGFVAKEPAKGHTVNVVRDLKLYEDVFTHTELSKLNDFVNQLRVAGRNGKLSGETFILYNQQTRGNKRELIQLGVPIFGHVKEDDSNSNTFQRSCTEAIPSLLEGVIDHLIQWRLLPENRKPNSCIINFFDEGEYSQPFVKPPHIEQPLSTLLLSESTMAFGRMLVADGEGNYRGPLMISLKEGSLLVMRGNSSETARHVMCSSSNKRASITFFRVRSEINAPEITTSSSTAMSLWQENYVDMIIPKSGLLRAPIVMLAPTSPMIANPLKLPRGGTGVFLPWNGGSRRHAKHLPPRAQRGRFLAPPPPTEAEIDSDSKISNS